MAGLLNSIGEGFTGGIKRAYDTLVGHDSDTKVRRHE